MDHSDNLGNTPNAVPEPDSHELTDETVGYGKPPLKRRFKSGQSGNQRGRPRGSKNRKTIVIKIANEMHTVTEDGDQHCRSTLEWLLVALRNRAVDGDVRAFRAYSKLLAKFEPQDHLPLGVLVVPAVMTPEEAIAEGEKANEEARARRAAQFQE